MAANNNNAATVGISHNEAMTIAMVENARKSSASENLQNAIEAQEKFMLGSHTENKPEFLNKIKKRADELTGTQHPPERRQKNWYRMGSDWLSTTMNEWMVLMEEVMGMMMSSDHGIDGDWQWAMIGKFGVTVQSGCTYSEWNRQTDKQTDNP